MTEQPGPLTYAEYLAQSRTQSDRDRLRMTETQHHDHERTVMDVHRLRTAKAGTDRTLKFEALNRALQNAGRPIARLGDAARGLAVVIIWEESEE